MTDHAAVIAARGLLATGLLAFAAGAAVHVFGAAEPEPIAAQPPVVQARPERTRAQFGNVEPSSDVRRVADWAVASDDPRGVPFLVIDKKRATLYVFDAQGVLAGAAPVLLGQARGDHSVAGIGEREIADVQPHERTTPAGRFVTQVGRNSFGEDIVWIDHASAVSLHRVRTAAPAERRLERLASASIADNRISFGCINVAKDFYERVVQSHFYATPGVAYVLPEAGALHQVFAGLPAPAHAHAVVARRGAVLQ